MSDIIIFNVTPLGLFIFTILMLAYVGGQYIYTHNAIKDYKADILREVLGKLDSKYSDKGSSFYANTKGGTFIEGLEDYKPSEIKPVKSKPLSAVEANKLKQASVTQEEVDTLLKPVFDKVAKASKKGDSEIFLSGSDWYYNKNEKYKTATQQLSDLGYSVWKDNNGFGIRIKW